VDQVVAQDFLDSARSLAPLIATLRERFDRERLLPGELVETLGDAGVFRDVAATGAGRPGTRSALVSSGHRRRAAAVRARSGQDAVLTREPGEAAQPSYPASLARRWSGATCHTGARVTPARCGQASDRAVVASAQSRKSRATSATTEYQSVGEGWR